MTFPRMNDKPRDIRTACTMASVPADSADDQAKARLRNEQLSERIASSRCKSVDELRSLAEEEFADSYGSSPTCAVFAPGCLTVAGKSVADLPETRSLSMAVQLVTLVVGKRSHGGKRCQVKRLLDSGERESCEFRLNDANLCIAAEEASWIRCLKGTIRSFKERRAGQVPGFKVVIVSSLPAKLGLGSNAALVVALYMFLEAIANTCTGNLVERMLACHLAERLATASNPCKVRASDILASIVGNEGQIFAFDARSLDVDRLRWNDTHVQLVLVELSRDDLEEKWKSLRSSKTRCEQVATVMNTTSRWRAHPIDASPMMALLFPREIMEMANDAILRDDQTTAKMTSAIRRERWEEFGELLRENHRSVCKRLNFSPDDAKRIENMFEPTEGVLGVSVVNYGASVVTLVRKSKLKTFTSFLSRAGQRYHLMEACTGASTIYAIYERIARRKYPSHPRLTVKHHLHEKINIEESNVRKYDVPLYVDTVSLFVSRRSPKS